VGNRRPHTEDEDCRGKFTNINIVLFYMQKLQQLDLLIDEQKAQEPNPLYTFGDVTKQIYTHSVSIRHSQ
jgi:hypothetical protein